MKFLVLVSGIFLWALPANAQAFLRFWKGGGGDARWDNPANWFPYGVPGTNSISHDSVVLDNRIVSYDYTVVFPNDRLPFTMSYIIVAPDTARGLTIQLILPPTNLEFEAVQVSTFELRKGAIMRNSGGRTSQHQIKLWDRFVLRRGSEYVHNSESRIDFFTAIVEGTIRFNVPAFEYVLNLGGLHGKRKVVLEGNATPDPTRGIAYTLLSAGMTDTLIIDSRTHLKHIGTKFQVANLVIDGVLDLTGSDRDFDLRLLPYDDTKNASLSGSGAILTNSRRIDINSPGDGATLLLQRDLYLGYPLHSFILNDGATLDMGDKIIRGSGVFRSGLNTKMIIGSRDGIWASSPFGNVQTATRIFNDNAKYEYNGSGLQHTGDGLPASIAELIINKPTGEVRLTRPTTVRNRLGLLKGRLITSAASLLTYHGGNEYGSPENLYDNHYGWEQSFVSGPMAIRIDGVGWVSVIPVGKGNTFAPVILVKRNAGPVTYNIEYFQSTVPAVTAVEAPLHHISRVEYWTIRSDVATTVINPADDSYVYLSWRPLSRIASTPAGRMNLRVARYENSDFRLRWEQVSHGGIIGTPSGSNYGFTSFVHSNATDFSPEKFTLGSLTTDNPMAPIELPFVVRRVQEIKETNTILYPNPVTSVLQVNVAASAIEIINPAGQLVKKQTVSAGNKINVDMSGLPGGTYFLRVFNNGKPVTYPFVKQ